MTMTDLQDLFERDIETVADPQLWAEIQARATEPRPQQPEVRWAPPPHRRWVSGLVAVAVFLAAALIWPVIRNDVAPPADQNPVCVPGPLTQVGEDRIGGPRNLLAASSATDIWDLGWGGTREATLEHFDGTTWSRIDLPSGVDPRGWADLQLDDRHQPWLLGRDSQGQMLTFRYDSTTPLATTWIPAYLPPDARFTAFAFAGPDDAWAVGSSGRYGPGSTPVLAHWDGESWGLVIFSPTARLDGSSLSGLSFVAPNDAWATGVTWNGSMVDATAHPLLIHWNGAEWSPMDAATTLPTDAFAPSDFRNIAADSPTDAWVLAFGDSTSVPSEPWALLHFDGVGWTTDRTSSEPFVLAAGGGGVWLEEHGARHLEHWDGTAWSSTPPLANGLTFFDTGTGDLAAFDGGVAVQGLGGFVLVSTCGTG
jgi:hypothetical protein